MYDKLSTDIISTAKDCPFCGNRPYIHVTTTSMVDKYQIGCTNKRCFIHSLVYAAFDSPEQVIREWNKRK